MYKPSLFLLATTFLGVTPTFAKGGPDHSDGLKLYTIKADDITASLIPYGARLTSLLVPDRDGKRQDIAVGFDDPHRYVEDTLTDHSYFGTVVGRYANRIGDGTFKLDGETYEIPKNEKDAHTLHGGDVGYDQRNWTVTAHTEDSITFTLYDYHFEGFPGDVVTHATYTVKSECPPGETKPRPQLITKTVSIALTGKTPIMLSNHLYWNLNGFKAHDVLDDTYLHMPLSKRFIKTDPELIPTGEIGDVEKDFDGSMDFQSPKLVGKDIEAAVGVCGEDCVGYDNCWLVDREKEEPDWTSSPDTVVPMLNMNSTITGISMQVATNQRAVQIYSCAGMNGTIPVKRSQVERNKKAGDKDGAEKIEQYGCVVVEPEGWIDGINNPDWGQDAYQIFSPETGPAVNWATYTFGAQ